MASSYEKFKDNFKYSPESQDPQNIPLSEYTAAAPSTAINLDELNVLPVVAQPQSFSPNLLDPISMQVYNGFRDKHMSSTSLFTSVDHAGNQLNNAVNGQFASLKGSMGYTELLAGLLYRGENLVRYGHFQFLQYSHLVVCDENNVTVSTRTGGVCLLSDKRILFLSSQITRNTSMKEWGNAKTLPGGYILQANIGDATAYLPIPLRFFRSVEMNGSSGARGEILISGTRPCCGGLCGFCGLCCSMAEWLKQWMSGTVTISQHSEMTISLGVLMPPWERRMYLHIHVNTSTPTVVVRDFIAVLQQHATGLN